MKKLYLLLVGLILYQDSGFSQFDYNKEGKELGVISEQLTDALTADLDSLTLDSIIIAYKNSQSIPGIATMIIKDNEIIWNKNYGYRNLQNQLPVEDSTLFLMASVSKTFVATAVMQLWENGVIDLQGNINDYLPTGFTVANPYYPSDVITVKMLITHTSSLLDNWNIMYPLISCGDSPISLNTFLVNYLTPGGTYYSPSNFGNYHTGQQWNYTSVGCGLLALIIENLTGKSFDEYCRDSIFIPLSMNSTSWFLEGLNINNIATPYDGSTPICHQGWPLYPPAFLRTNKNDLSKFLLAYMNDGVYNNGRILDSTTISYMISDQLGYSVTYQAPWWIWKQGLLWFNAYLINNSTWGHAGSWPGCLTYMCYDPLEKWGTIWFQNWRPISGSLTNFGQVSYYFTQYGDCYGSIYLLTASVNKSYAIKKIDSVLFLTRFKNIYNHPITPHLIYEDLDSTQIDSLTIFDDGLHGDSLANDGLYGGFVPPRPIEDFFTLSVSIVNNQTNEYLIIPDLCRFTTVGPVILDSLSINQGSNNFSVIPFLKNESTVTTITNASVRLICNDPWIISIIPSSRDLPNILPGVIVSPVDSFLVTVDYSIFPGVFNFEVEVLSEGWIYWKDSIQIIITGFEDLKNLPLIYKVEQNYPNPFNPFTMINWQIPEGDYVTLKVYDILGREVVILVDEFKPAGKYETEFNASSLPSGIYFYQLKAGEYTETRKMLLLK